jgi:hypothetical protein
LLSGIILTMRAPIHELDIVALTVDVPGEGLTAGNVGTVVHVHNPTTFEVEFEDRQGRTYTLATLRAEQLLQLRYESVAEQIPKE